MNKNLYCCYNHCETPRAECRVVPSVELVEAHNTSFAWDVTKIVRQYNDYMCRACFDIEMDKRRKVNERLGKEWHPMHTWEELKIVYPHEHQTEK